MMKEKKTTAVAKRNRFNIPMLTSYGVKDKEVELITRMIQPKASRAEMALFFRFCDTYDLDPWQHEAHLIPYYHDGKVRHMPTIGIGALRRKAIQTGKYVPGDFEELISDSTGKFIGIRYWAYSLTIRGWRKYNVVTYLTEVQKTKDGRPIAQWRIMPRHMCEKCAEAKFIRRYVLLDLGGAYIPDEINAGEQPDFEEGKLIPKKSQPEDDSEEIPYDFPAPKDKSGVQDGEFIPEEEFANMQPTLEEQQEVSAGSDDDIPFDDGVNFDGEETVDAEVIEEKEVKKPKEEKPKKEKIQEKKPKRPRKPKKPANPMQELNKLASKYPEDFEGTLALVTLDLYDMPYENLGEIKEDDAEDILKRMKEELES